MLIEDVEEQFTGALHPLPNDYRYILERIEEPSLDCGPDYAMNDGGNKDRDPKDNSAIESAWLLSADDCIINRASHVAAASSAYSAPVPVSVPVTEPVTVSNTCNVGGIGLLQCNAVSGNSSTSSSFNSRYMELQREALYMTHFVGANAIYDLSVDELASIMQSHGLIHAMTTKDPRRLFVEHLLLGKCFEHQLDGSEACRSSCDIFDSRKSMACYLLHSIILNEHDLCRLKEICRGLGMTDRELYYVDNEEPLIRYISYCKDCFIGLPLFDEIACSLDSMPPYDLLMLARLHRITIDNRASFEAIKCELLAHFGEGLCVFKNSEVVPSCYRRADSEIASRLKLLQRAITCKIGKRQCERMLNAFNVSFESGLTKRQLLNTVKDELRFLQKGKYNQNKRVIRSEEEQQMYQKRSEDLRILDENWPSPIAAELKHKLISDFQASTKQENLLEQTCSVCAESKKSHEMHSSLIPADDPILQKLEFLYPEGCPNPFENDQFLSKLVVEPRGVLRSTEHEIASLGCH